MTHKHIHTCEDARDLARRRMPRMLFDFIDGAAGQEIAARDNKTALTRIRLQPRVLVNTGERVLATTLLSEEMNLPFGVAPMGMCDLTWPGADQMLARVAEKNAIPLCVSTASSTSLENLYKQSGGRAWFQLYADKSSDDALRLVERVAAASYTHLIVTVDVPQVARRVRDLKNRFRVPFQMRPRQVLDFALHPRWSLSTLFYGIPRMMNFASADGFTRNASRGAADWKFLDQLRTAWHGKLIIKGVLSAQDAQRIKSAGADAVYVSNHGGRQLDSAPPAIDALPQIRAAVGDDYPLLFDSGVRSGEDVVKALASGADFVMLGCPLLYAIGADGARGLDALINIFAEEISLTLAQLGASRVGDINPDMIVDPTHSPNQ